MLQDWIMLEVSKEETHPVIIHQKIHWKVHLRRFMGLSKYKSYKELIIKMLIRMQNSVAALENNVTIPPKSDI